MALDTNILREYLEADAERNRLKSELAVVEEDRSRLAEIIVQMLGLEGLKSANVILPDGSSRTVHLRRELWAGHTGNSQALCDALKDSGYASYVQEKFNVQSLSALVKELASEFHDKSDVSTLTVEQIMESVPEAVRQHLKISEIFKVGSKKSG